MTPAAMHEALLALEGHRKFLSFQAVNRRKLGAQRADLYEARLPIVDQAIEEVKAKLGSRSKAHAL